MKELRKLGNSGLRSNLPGSSKAPSSCLPRRCASVLEGQQMWLRRTLGTLAGRDSWRWQEKASERKEKGTGLVLQHQGWEVGQENPE